MMQEALHSNHPEGVPDSFDSKLPKVFGRIQGTRSMSAISDNVFLRAVHAREYCADAPDGVEVWKYTFPLAGHGPVDDIHVRCRHVRYTRGAQWTGIFECARGRHVEVLPWPAANAIVVAAANAVYIVDPAAPERFSGLAAPVEITGVTFDESAQHMFVADSLRVYAFSSDHHFRWISEPLDGYDARFRGCGGRVLAVQIKQCEPGPDGEEAVPSMIRLRTEDGTILRSRFRLAHDYRLNNAAA